MPATGMWVEKYRPQKLSEIVNQAEIIGSLEALIKDPTDMPHLLFSGSAGVGEITLIDNSGKKFSDKVGKAGRVPGCKCRICNGQHRG